MTNITLPKSTWQLQDAKNRFSEVINSTQASGPQIITRHGTKTAVIMSYQDYHKFIKPNKDLKQLLMNSELNKLDLTRDKSTTGRATTVGLD